MILSPLFTLEVVFLTKINVLKKTYSSNPTKILQSVSKIKPKTKTLPIILGLMVFVWFFLKKTLLGLRRLDLCFTEQ